MLKKPFINLIAIYRKEYYMNIRKLFDSKHNYSVIISLFDLKTLCYIYLNLTFPFFLHECSLKKYLSYKIFE